MGAMKKDRSQRCKPFYYIFAMSSFDLRTLFTDSAIQRWALAMPQPCDVGWALDVQR
jgi:hypothetical protein